MCSSDLSAIQNLSQYTLKISNSCEYRCIGCSIWKEKETSLEVWKKLIDENLFFKKYPQKKVFNLVGGEPLNCLDIQRILLYLRDYEIKARVWTHGGYELDYFEKLNGLVSEYVLFFPATTKKEYQEYTGKDSWENFNETCRYLISQKQYFWISYPVTSDSVQEIPAAYELAYQLNAKLLLHFSSRNNMSKESKRYINRFRRVRNVWVLKEASYNSSYCCSVPIQALNSRFQLFRNIVDDGLGSFRRIFGY